MNRAVKYFLQALLLISLLFIVWISGASHIKHKQGTAKVLSGNMPGNPIPDDTMPYPFSDDPGYPFDGNGDSNSLYLHNPPNVIQDVTYDPETNSYIFTNQAGGEDISPPNTMTMEEFMKYDADKQLKDYWKEKIGESGGKGKTTIPKIHIGGEVFDKIFGGSTIDIRPQGSAELIFGLNSIRRDDPALNVRQRKTTNFDFQEKIQMSVTAKIGDKIQLGTNYNTEATFDFENKMKLAYEGKEDEIIKLIEAGDVTLPLNSTLITGSQALFGLKTKLQFGKTTVTGVFSQQKSKTSTIEVADGAQVSEFDVKADQYEENKHFFIGQHFRNNYNNALSELPIIKSNVNITKMEVWITNIGAATTDNRNVVAFMDLGEYNPYNTASVQQGNYNYNGNPDNGSNSLYASVDKPEVRKINTASTYLTSLNFVSGQDFEKVELCKKLLASEYTYNSKLGFISLNTSINSDQVLAVAYQYTLVGDTTVYQVGDFSTEIAGPNALIVKLLKSKTLSTNLPTWKLMMKNVYALGAYQVNSDDFRLNVVYTSNENGVPAGYFTQGNSNVKGVPIIRLLNLDRLNTQLDLEPDGVFDFIGNAATTGGTIQASNGRVYFPVLEPFGKDLRAKFNDDAIADLYCYDSLYTLTKVGAQQYPDKNKFSIIGSYKSAAGSEISLNAMNVPQGSVKVTAGGITLTENVDYTVDYSLGRVKIINEGILNSGTPIQINLESNSLFNIQTKTLMGAHFDHKVSKDFVLGATILNLSERPITQKINFGDEPISNTIWGLNGTYEKESVFITKLLDKLPFYSTKTASKITATGEFAHLIPGHARAIGKTGTSYIDDFEGSKSSVDMKNIGSWYLASTPQGQESKIMFPEGALSTGLAYRYNAARFCWYVIDPLFLRKENTKPDHITTTDQSNHYVREVLEKEVFPKKETQDNIPTPVAVLNLAFYPRERGQYNYDSKSGIYSSGVASDGSLNDPETRWGGIMRKIETTDFEATNIEYIEFWMMDPFIDPDGSGPLQPIANGGDLYFNLGDISEDVCRDSRKSFENGLPLSADDITTDLDTTEWGLVPAVQAVTNSFDNNPDSRKYQDVGYDGLMDIAEKTFFDSALINLNSILSAQAYQDFESDPSSDNYHYFRGKDYDNNKVSILDRYKKYNGMDGNSPISGASGESYPTQATTIPNAEDINKDNTLDDQERYFQYKVQLTPDKMAVGINYITDMYDATGIPLPNNTTATTRWYQFKIPVQSPDKIVGNIKDFKSIRFMRMFMKNWTENAILRFATLELVRGEWRKYNFAFLSPGEYLPTDDVNNTIFDISVVNIEENGKKIPVPYVIPPGIERELFTGPSTPTQMNEQSLSLKVCNLMDGDIRACYKTCDFDMRQFNTLRMFVHAEAGSATEPLNYGDLTIFMRLGTDFTGNYYEYEIPLKPTPWYTSVDDITTIWPSENEFNITLKVLQDAKLARNEDMRVPGSGVTLTEPYVVYDNGNKVSVVGMPTLSGVKVLMIGIRNPKRSSVTPDDDGLPKCAEIWVNELRLTDFKEQGGWAATSSVNATLADLGTMTVAGKISTPGFGSIEKKVNERAKETIKEFAFATSIELGKLLPGKTGIKIPMHFDYSHNASNPQYNPLSPDILFRDELDTYNDKKERDSVKALAQELTVRKSINFVNVQKEKTGTSSKSHIYDVENLDFTYSYTEQYHRDIDVEFDKKKTYKGSVGYNFTASPKNHIPFSKVKLFSAGPLKLIKDFNFYLFPKTLTFRTDLDRLYSENKIRNKSKADIIIDTSYIKSFEWKRNYGLKYDLTTNLKVDFTAAAEARILEPPGKIDRKDPSLDWKRDTIMKNIKNLGKPDYYDQTLNVNYTIPINKISWFSWVTASAKYSGNYSWTAAPLSTAKLGNVIENSNTKQLNGNFSLTNLYNKSGYLKKLNAKKTAGSKTSANTKTPVKSKGKSKKPDTDSTDTDSAEVIKTDYVKVFTENVLKFLMGVKTVSFTYSQGNGTLLPGYMPAPRFMGMNSDWNAPGWGYVFGDTTGIRQRAGKNGWVSNDPDMNNPFSAKYTENVSARVSVEPINKFLIEITASRTFSKNHSEYFKWDSLSNDYKSFSPVETGAFSVSFFTWKTAFMRDDKVSHSNKVFELFKSYRIIIANRLANENPNWDGTYFTDSISGEDYPAGYGPTSQEVLIPAFLAAYSHKEPEKVSLHAFSEKFSLRDIPLPNWKITYDGLIKIPFIKKYFKTLTMSHSYKSTYSVGAYTSNILFKDNDGDGYTDVKEKLSGNFVPNREISLITVSEQFSPLINLDMTWNNSLLSNFEIKRSRNLSLSFANNQLTEINSNEAIIGLGYRIKNVVINVKGVNGGKLKKLKSDLNLKADISFKTNKTILRKIIEEVNQISTGQRIISINFSADYLINDKFTVKFFFDKIITNPFVSSQFPNANTNAGFSFKFTLAQ